jgi:hypothetical protein
LGIVQSVGPDLETVPTEIKTHREGKVRRMPDVRVMLIGAICGIAVAVFLRFVIKDAIVAALKEYYEPKD